MENLETEMGIQENVSEIVKDNFGSLLWKIAYTMFFAWLLSAITDFDYSISFVLVIMVEFATTLFKAIKEKGYKEDFENQSVEYAEAVEVANNNFQKYQIASEKLAIFEQKSSELELLLSEKTKALVELNSSYHSLVTESKTLFLDNQSHAAKIVSLQNKNSSLTLQIESLTEQRESLNFEIQTLKESLASLKVNLDSQIEELDLLRTENKSLKAAISAYKGVEKRRAEKNTEEL